MLNKDVLFCSEIMRKKHADSVDLRDYEKHEDLKIGVIHNGIIHPLEILEAGKSLEDEAYGGVTDEDLNFVEISLNKRAKGENVREYPKWYIGANHTYNFDDITYLNEDVIFFGPIHPSVTHFYLECFSRSWIFLDLKYSTQKIAYYSMEEELRDYHKEFFKLLGIDMERMFNIKRPVKFRNVIIPEQSLKLNLSYHPMYKAIFDKMGENIKPLGYDKIYFSKTNLEFSWRNGIRFRTHIGTKKMDDIFRKNGFHVMRPENMSISDTIAALKGCKIFAAESGSNAHNAIFMQDNAELLVLNRSEHFHPVQTMINKMKNLKTTYVDCFYPNLPINWSAGPFIFYFSNFFIRYLKQNNFIFDKSITSENTKNLKEFMLNWHLIYDTICPKEFKELQFTNEMVLELVNDVNMLNREPKTFLQKIFKIK